MLRTKVLAVALASVACGMVAKADDRRGHFDGPLVLAHRGANGYVPEHTLAAYFIAIQQGADYVEPDLVPTKDGVLVARQKEITDTTDVADHPEFASRRTTRTVDTLTLTGWGNTRFDGMFEVPTLEEVLQLVDSVNEQRLKAWIKDRKPYRPVGLYLETKHPSYFQRLGLPVEERLVALLHRFGYSSRKDPVFLQSFEVGNLKKLSRLTRLPIVQLLNASGKPFDFVLSGDPRTYADLVKPAGLAEIAKYADGIGPNKDLIIPRRPDNALGTPTSLIADAHALGPVVHGFVFRVENNFLPTAFGR